MLVGYILTRCVLTNRLSHHRLAPVAKEVLARLARIRPVWPVIMKLPQTPPATIDAVRNIGLVVGYSLGPFDTESDLKPTSVSKRVHIT